jgi:hypothetical protein
MDGVNAGQPVEQLAIEVLQVADARTGVAQLARLPLR